MASLNIDFNEIFAASDIEGFFTSLAQSERSKETDDPDEEVVNTKFKIITDGANIQAYIETSDSLVDRRCAEKSIIWKENAMKMIKTLLPQHIKDSVYSAKDIIGSAVKEYIYNGLVGATT